MRRQFADWLASTAPSALLQHVLWIIPLSQSIHLIALATLFTSALIINARLLDLTPGARRVSALVATQVPWMWRALLVLLLTGTVQAVAEPVRQFVTPAFWIKMGLIALAAILTVRFARAVRADAAAWDDARTRPSWARPFAVISTLAWTGAIVCGRLIGYTWYFYAAPGE